jgi:hypothetical protein
VDIPRTREGDPVALVLDRLETIIELLDRLAGALMTPEGLNLGSLEAILVRQNLLLEWMMAASLPSAPLNVRTITVPTTEILLASNESQPLMRVDVHNLNVAQPLTVSKRGVSATSGIQILARQTTPFVLPAGSQLYGVVALGTILVTVSEGYDIRPALDALAAAGG